jgi:dynein heavy chain
VAVSFIGGGNLSTRRTPPTCRKDNISDRVLKKIGTYCSQSDFQPEVVGRVSTAAKSLCMWVRAMEVYGRIYRVVEPKKQRLNAAQSQLKEKQDALSDAKAKLAEVIL